MNPLHVLGDSRCKAYKYMSSIIAVLNAPNATSDIQSTAVDGTGTLKNSAGISNAKTIAFCQNERFVADRAASSSFLLERQKSA